MKLLREMKWQSLIGSAIYIIMGIVLLVFPENVMPALCYVVGIVGVVIGVFTVLAYLFRDVQKNYYRNDFTVGMVEILLGAFVLYKASEVGELIMAIMGILVVLSGIGKLQNCIDVRRMNYGTGLVFFILAVINIAFGVVLIVDPFGAARVLAMVIGAGLVFSGVTDAVATLYMSKKVKNFVSTVAVMDQEFREVKPGDE
ncbi:MAG: hypothetical protein HDR26_03950 [Lachnospiraceae bacterium]|nr:hypothetical protein [Lachnospiraceae bacterium]